MTKVARLFEEEKNQAVEQAVEKQLRLVVTNMLNEGLDENQIVRFHPQASLEYVRKIQNEINSVSSQK